MPNWRAIVAGRATTLPARSSAGDHRTMAKGVEKPKTKNKDKLTIQEKQKKKKEKQEKKGK
jgi:hypothetical protein